MNPPKRKTLLRPFKSIAYAIEREILRSLATVTRHAQQLWAWLCTHTTGWEFDPEQVAAFYDCSTSSIYNGALALETLGLLRRDEDQWTLLLPDSTAVEPARSTKTRGRAGALPPEKDKKHTYSEKRSNVVEPARKPVGMSETKPEKDRPQPVKAKPTNAPDHHDRDLVSCVDRVVIEKFLRAWSAEFSDGPSAGHLPVLPSMWQQRILWLWQYWTADELRDAFIATRDAVPRKPWKYFCACLDRIAEGSWGDGPAAPDTVRYIGGAFVDRDQDPDRLAEAKLEAVDADPPDPDDPDELAYHRGEITLDEWFKRRTARGNS